MIDVLHSLGGLPRLHFSNERTRHLESLSDDLVDNALHAYDQFHAHKMLHKTAQHWRLVKRKKSLNVYRERGRPTNRESRKYLCSGVMPGTVKDMICGAYFDDTESMRIGLSVLMDRFLDARVLHVFEKNTIHSRSIFAGIKWLAFKAPTSASLIHDRDLLFYYRIGRIVDRRGRYFVYCVLNSIELDEFPANRHHHLERSALSFCFLFRQVQEEWVGCFIIGSLSLGGTLPRSLSEHMTADLMAAVGNLLVVARAKAFSARVAASADRLPSTSLACDVCMKKATLLSGSFKLCMGCRRNTCRKCREWCIVFCLEWRTQKPGKERFCSQCIADVTRPTMSSFYLCSLHESTSSTTDFHSRNSGSPSVSNVKLQDSNLLPSPSHGIAEAPVDVQRQDLPQPLDGLAHFVERASVASATREMQWNQDELDYFSDLLRESGHLTRHESCVESTSHSQAQSCTQACRRRHLSPPPAHHNGVQNDAATKDPRSPQTVFCVDELD